MEEKDDQVENIRKAINGYIMNRGQDIIQGQADKVTLTVEECLDFINNVLEFDSNSSALLTGYLVATHFEIELYIVFSMLSGAVFYERNARISLDKFVRSNIYGNLLEVSIKVI